MPTYEDLRKMKKAYEEARDAGAKDALRDHFKGLFELHPDVAAIRWRQYTPYFNDGEPCTFRVCDPEVLLVGRNPDVDEYNEGEDNQKGWEFSWELKHPIFKQIELDEDFVRFLGEHVKITISREMEMEVKEYEHE
jgi:hypothetical protein